ncbi:MAG: GNAT family N-acetyltransferase [Ilumatobacter sp.]|uniref:GNAT family N-acetyltransferase n=1 Tax=Ilumatobacter sp. TaxID=1967498 RepID=UPI003C72D8D9
MSVPRFEPLLTDRLTIRPLRPDDVDPLWKRRNDTSTAEFQNWTLPYPKEKAQQLVDEMVGFDAAPPPDGWIQFAIDDAVTGLPIGDLALGLTFAGRCAEIGWSIDATQRGRGVATEAAATLVTWLFESVGVTRVQAMTHPDNLASVRVAERIGMVFEGHTRNSYWVGDENSDDWIFAMTRDDWTAWVARSSVPPTAVGFVEITRENLVPVERMATHRSQQRFVSTVPQSFADALVPKIRGGEPVVSWYRGVEADGELVGFVMATEPTPGQSGFYLRRLLIDRMHQRRGIGGRVLDLLIERARSLGADALHLSWVDGPGSPAPLYVGRGFEPTGEFDEGETVARLDLS